VVVTAQIAHASYDLCATLHLRDLGASGTYTGVFWALGVVAEVLLMAQAGPVFARASARRLLVLGIAGATVRWALLASVTSLPVLLALQPLHALSFALVWLACLAHLKEHVAPHVAATAQGLFTTAVALGSVSGMLAWGPLYRARGGAVVFGAAALVSAVALALALAFARRRAPEPARAR
ncbi:MAG TPA: MFS transporter, partial [Minicystis sp.]|nr:MFS transporter [Minicystis sp.]